MPKPAKVAKTQHHAGPPVSELAEMALAHAIGDKVDAAYRRGDMFDKRRRMMDEWAGFCATVEAPAAQVLPLRRVG